jgi:hypothetical protein
MVIPPGKLDLPDCTTDAPAGQVTKILFAISGKVGYTFLRLQKNRVPPLGGGVFSLFS